MHPEESLLRRSARFNTLLVVGLAIAASITGLSNGFTLDDVHVIVENERLHSLGRAWRIFIETYWPPDDGDTLYRPLTSLGFALQWAVGKGSPLPFHVVSIALYAAVCALGLRLARQLFSEAPAVIGAALFAVHPLHVESVASVVGQAELWVALLLIAAVSRYLSRSRDGVSLREGATLCLMYVAALAFKEHAIVLPALLLATEILPSTRPQTLGQRARRVAPLMLAMAVSGGVFVLIRAMILDKLTGGSTATVFIDQGFTTRLFTMLPVMIEWIRLFLWPATLSADYSPPRIVTITSFQATMLPALMVVIGSAAIALYVRRRYPSVTFAYAWTAITLLIPSNLFVVTGFVLAERALFLPSLGVMMLVGAAIAAVLRYGETVRVRRVALAVVSLAIVAGVARSSVRNPVWKDNEALFRQTVEDVPSSSRAHLMLGEVLTNSGQVREGLMELLLAARLADPRDVFVRAFAADRHHAAGRLETAMLLYEQALAIDSMDAQVRYGAAVCLTQLGRHEEARVLAVESLRRNHKDSRFAEIVYVADSVRTLRERAGGAAQ